MASPEDEKGAQTPPGGAFPASESIASSAASEEGPVTAEPTPSAPYEYYEDPYAYPDSTPVSTAVAEPAPAPVPAPATATGSGGSTPPPPPPRDPEDDEEDGMLRMSFLGHLEELRMRLLLSLAGVGVAFVISLTFANQLWLFVQAPAEDALTRLGFQDPKLTQITPMEIFNTVWVKLPILSAVFIASPWILYQIWAFIAPGLYKRERRWAAPFIICSAGLFILGGVFAYFVAFRFGLVFLLGIGRDINIRPMVSVTEYFDLFVNVMLGIGLVFELPVLIFFLTLLRIITPGFLLRNSRYAILLIFIVAAVVTPTPDVVNLMLFAMPMCLLFYMGIFASYLLVLQRENRKFPWRKVLYGLLVAIFIAAGVLYLAVTKYGYHLVPQWPFFTR